MADEVEGPALEPVAATLSWYEYSFETPQREYAMAASDSGAVAYIVSDEVPRSRRSRQRTIIGETTFEAEYERDSLRTRPRPSGDRGRGGVDRANAAADLAGAALSAPDRAR